MCPPPQTLTHIHACTLYIASSTQHAASVSQIVFSPDGRIPAVSGASPEGPSVSDAARAEEPSTASAWSTPTRATPSAKSHLLAPALEHCDSPMLPHGAAPTPPSELTSAAPNMSSPPTAVIEVPTQLPPSPRTRNMATPQSMATSTERLDETLHDAIRLLRATLGSASEQDAARQLQRQIQLMYDTLMSEVAAHKRVAAELMDKDKQHGSAQKRMQDYYEVSLALHDLSVFQLAVRTANQAHPSLVLYTPSPVHVASSDMNLVLSALAFTQNAPFPVFPVLPVSV